MTILWLSWSLANNEHRSVVNLTDPILPPDQQIYPIRLVIQPNSATNFHTTRQRFLLRTTTKQPTNQTSFGEPKTTHHIALRPFLPSKLPYKYNVLYGINQLAHRRVRSTLEWLIARIWTTNNNNNQPNNQKKKFKFDLSSLLSRSPIREPI